MTLSELGCGLGPVLVLCLLLKKIRAWPHKKWVHTLRYILSYFTSLEVWFGVGWVQFAEVVGIVDERNEHENLRKIGHISNHPLIIEDNWEQSPHCHCSGNNSPK